MKFKLNGAIKAVQMQADGQGITPNAEVGPKWFRDALERGHITPYIGTLSAFGETKYEYGYHVCTRNNKNQKPNCSYDETVCNSDWIILDANEGLHCMTDAAFRSMFKVKDSLS